MFVPHKKAYETIIFDLGGVLLNLDYSRTVMAFEKLGLKNADEFYSKAQQTALFDDLETGDLSEEDFRSYFREHINEELKDSDIDDAWNAMLLDFPEERIHLLSKLKEHSNIYLFSNTNSIHLRAFRAILQQQFENDYLLEDIFIKAHYSHEFGMRKPHPETFKELLYAHGLNPKNTLFIDDSPQHIEGAKKIGIQAYHLENNEDISNLFQL